jgi:hypothetical protein
MFINIITEERCHRLKLPMIDDWIDLEEDKKGECKAKIEIEEEYLDDIKRIGETNGFKVTKARG